MVTRLANRMKLHMGGKNGLPIVSGSTRGCLNSINLLGKDTRDGGVTYDNVWVSRVRDVSNVTCRRPSFLFWHGGTVTNGSQTPESFYNASLGGTATFRAAVLTGDIGNVANQKQATLTKLTFFNMLKNAAFVAAGGTVSADGLLVTVPAVGWWVWSDYTAGVILNPGEYYYTQLQYTKTSSYLGSVYLYSNVCRGDRGGSTTQGSSFDATQVYSTNWTITSTTNSGFFLHGHFAVRGFGNAGTKTVVVDGDSIVAADQSNGNLIDLSGARGWLKRGLNLARYSYFDVSLAGTSIHTIQNDPTTFGIRREIMKLATGAIITDHMTNDRGGSNAPWGSSAVTSLSSRNYFHNQFLRSVAPLAKIIRCTILQYCGSTDNFATSANQVTLSGNDCIFPGGNQYLYADYLMRRGAYLGIPFSNPSDPDGAFDFYAVSRQVAVLMGANDVVDGKWPCNGIAKFFTLDGLHPATPYHTLLSIMFAQQALTLFGFGGGDGSSTIAYSGPYAKSAVMGGLSANGVSGLLLNNLKF